MAPTQEESKPTIEERWEETLNSLGKAPLCKIPLKLHRGIFKSKKADVNQGNAMLSLPMDILVDILTLAGPLAMYNVTLTCKWLTRVVFGHRALLYPNPRLTSNRSRFEFRSDVLGAGFPTQLPLFVADHSNSLPRSRQVVRPRISGLYLVTGCYRCCLTKKSPNNELYRVGRLEWMQHLRQELDLIETPCTRGILQLTVMELVVWFGDLIVEKGSLRTRNLPKTRAARERELEQTLPRFQLWIAELEHDIDRQLRLV